MCALNGFADDMGSGWVSDKTVEVVGIHANYQGTQYAYFSIAGSGLNYNGAGGVYYAFDIGTEYGKKMYAILLASKANSSFIHFYTGANPTANTLLWGGSNNAIGISNIRTH